MLVKYMVMLLETMLQDARDEGFAEGQFLEELDNLKRLMKKLNMTLEEAMDFSDIPENERAKYISVLKKDPQ